MLETQVYKKIKKYVDGYFLRIDQTGHPDIIVYKNNKHILIEVKIDSGSMKKANDPISYLGVYQGVWFNSYCYHKNTCGHILIAYKDGYVLYNIIIDKFKIATKLYSNICCSSKKIIDVINYLNKNLNNGEQNGF